MDGQKRDENDKDGAGRPSQPRGTANLRVDSFKSGTGALHGMPGGTRKVGTTGFSADKTLVALKYELETGETVIGKLEGRIAVLARAIRITEAPAETNDICSGLGAGEANFTKQVARMLQADQAVYRRVQVAVYQFNQARNGIAQAQEAHEMAAQYTGEAKTHFVENHCHVEKLRGQLYPLINMHVVFKDNPLLGQLIPAPKAVVLEEAPLPPLPPSQGTPKPAAGAGSLANDPAVRDMVDALQRVTGTLKDRFTGMLGLKPQSKPPEKK